jgi:periplasmic divalent cation tolerance protein
MQNDIIFIYTIHPDLSTAKMITQILLNKRLVACANIIPTVHSMYWWEDKIEESNELVVIFKTQKTHFEQCQLEIQKNHPYKVPCIIQIDAQKYNGSYGLWIKQETTPT